MKHLLTLLICVLGIQQVNAQSLSLFDVDASNFPTMKAKFFAFDVAGKQQRPSASELSLTENAIPRTITSVTCPTSSSPRPLSSVILIDISASMSSGQQDTPNIDLAKEFAKSWVKSSYMDISECAVTTFDHANYLNQDFTTDIPKLLNAISSIRPQGGTDYDAAFINPMASGLLVSKKGKQQKVVICLTDGQPYQEPQINSIISEAKKQDCIIYCITLGMLSPQSLKDLSNATNGLYFENISSLQEMQNVYRRIIQATQGIAPCEINWLSDVGCSTEKTNIEFTLESIKTYSSYITPDNAKGYLKVTPVSISLVKFCRLQLKTQQLH